MNKENAKEIVDVFNTLNEEQKTVVYYLVGKAVEDTEKEIKNEYERKLRLYLFCTTCIYEELFKETEEKNEET